MKKVFSIFLIVFIPAAIGLLSCAQSKETPKIQPLPAEEISPGSAIIKYEVTGFDERDDYFILTGKVKQVSRYGSSTQPIGDNSVLKSELKKNLIDRKFLEKGTLLDLEIQQPEEGMNALTNNIWKILRVIKK